MTLSELLEDKFRGDVRFRGVAYLKAERVSVTRVTADHVFAVVRDGIEYQTQLSRDDGQLKMYCNCLSGHQPDATCKHLWATVLAVDEGSYLSSSLKLGGVPPFTAEVEAVPVDDEDWDDEDPDNVNLSSGPGRAGHQDVPFQPRLKPWEVHLYDLRQEMEVHQPVAPTAGRQREIFYEIDVEQSRSVSQLVVETSQRQRRANGQWGKLKPLKLRPGCLDELDHEEDRQILAYLSGGTPERTNWYAQQAENQTPVYRYRVPQELCELILPLMCATGRVRFLNRTSPSLQWDDGAAWELSMCVCFNDERQQWQLEGQLHRNTNRRQLNRQIAYEREYQTISRARILKAVSQQTI